MRQLIPVAIVIIMLAGCAQKGSKHGTVKGKLTYKGQPVNNATLTFDPAGETKGSPVLIPVSQEGTFSSSDIPPGDYKVTVKGLSGNEGVPDTRRMDPSKMTPEMKAKLEALKAKQATPTIPFPAKYKQMNTSDLKVTITTGEQNLDLVLKD